MQPAGLAEKLFVLAEALNPGRYSMKVLSWSMSIIVGLPMLFFILAFNASELGGEVVTLERINGDNSISEVRIWIVDQDSFSWIEHGDRQAYWITELSESSEVILIRHGEALNYIGSIDPDAHPLYHKLRRQKYTWADAFIALLTGNADDCNGVPVRLNPRPTQSPASA